MAWYISRRDQDHILFEDETEMGVVNTVVPSKRVNEVTVRTENEVHTLFLSNYTRAERDPLSQCVSSRTKFVERWNELKEDWKTLSPQPILDGQMDEEKTDLGEKLAYPYALVHVENMISPAPERMLREVDKAHAKVIEELIQKRPDLKCHLLLGHAVTNNSTNLSHDLKTPGQVQVEIIGGNHTRVALQALQARNELRSLLWPAQVYCGLSNLEAHKLGFDHNIENEYSKPTSAMDLLKFFHKELKECENVPTEIMSRPKQLKLWRQNISHVLGCSKETLHNKHNTLCALAQSDVTLWHELMLLDQRCDAGTVRGLKKGGILTGHLKTFLKVDGSRQLQLLRSLNSDDITWQEFKHSCTDDVRKNSPKQLQDKQTVDNQPRGDAQNESQLSDVRKNSPKQLQDKQTVDNQPRGDAQNESQLRDMKKKLDSALQNVARLQAESATLKREFHQLKDEKDQATGELCSMKKQKLELEETIKLLRAEKTNLEEDLRYYLYKNSDSDSSKAGTSEDEIPQASEATATENTEELSHRFEIGDSVWAKFRADWYPATVIRVTNKDYIVEFTEDKKQKKVPLANPGKQLILK